MEASPALLAIASLLLVVGNAFFVSAEYAVVSVRRSSIEALAKRNSKSALRVLAALDELADYVAAAQIGITMLGIGTGAVAEPFVTGVLTSWFGASVNHTVGLVVSFLTVTFIMVVIGELCPKYIALAHTERTAYALVGMLTFFVRLFKPLVWLSQLAAGLILRPLRIDMNAESRTAVPRDELMLLVREGGEEGVLDTTHADMVARALKFDQLDARDIMVHRLDIKWIDLSLSKEDLLRRIKRIPFTRLPVCRGDIDDLVGIVYLHDIVKNLDDPNFGIAKILRAPVVIPENLPIDRVLEQMRDNKTQILIVSDEYGGTSGLVTLEDVIEEIFGELEDTIESERPAIEQIGSRISARAETRYDEIIEFLRMEPEAEPNTDTLATMMIEGLGHVPRPGDSISSPLGTMRVENMARRRITRVSINLKTTNDNLD